MKTLRLVRAVTMATLLAATRAAGQEFFGQGWTTDYPDADINFSIQFWRQSGGGTSERGEDSAEVHLRGIMDADGRIMVLMTHNTDISDAWEREGEDPQFFYSFSPNGYAVGLNTVLYAMSH